MAKRQGNNYFHMMKEMVECSLRAAVMLESVLKAFNPADLDGCLHELHEVEHCGDILKHQLVEKLSKEFITPIDREDIMDIVGMIDDVTDAIEDVLLKISMFHIQSIPENALDFAQIITQCVQALLNAFEELEDFKKSKTIHSALVEINRLEEKGDVLYFKGVKDLFVNKIDPLTAISWTEVYACLEKCCDSCENTADLVEQVIMKNT